jgi:hypothetical protein
MTDDEQHYRPRDPGHDMPVPPPPEGFEVPPPGGNLMGARVVREPVPETEPPDRYRCQITPGLSVVADASGLVLIETDLAVRRHPVRDVAVAVVALETARDVSGGGPSEGSPLQRATDALLTLAERVAQEGARSATADEIRQVWADLRYGPLPAEWMSRPVTSYACCPACLMRSRRADAGTQLLLHRPGCPEGGGHR